MFDKMCDLFLQSFIFIKVSIIKSDKQIDSITFDT